MIPTFLERYRSQLAPLKLNSVVMTATPLPENTTLPATQSKLLGTPYLPEGRAYPVSEKGTPLILLAQLNFAEIPPLPHYPQSGIVQLFIHPRNWFDMEHYQVLFHEDPTLPHPTDFSFLTPELYEESPVYCEHKLSFETRTEYGGPQDFRFQVNFGGKDYYEYMETLTDERQVEMDRFFDMAGHKIGGYAYFTQWDPREDHPDRQHDVLLFQIDTDEKIMFGDSGVSQVFIPLQALKNKDFSRAYFNWDCC